MHVSRLCHNMIIVLNYFLPKITEQVNKPKKKKFNNLINANEITNLKELINKIKNLFFSYH